MKRLKTILILMSMLAISSCKDKSAEPSPCVSENTRLLSSNNWQFNEIFVLISDSTFSPVNLPSCYKDDRRKYHLDGSFIHSNGEDLCSPQTEEDYVGEWKLINMETQIEFGSGELASIRDVKILTADSLMIEYETPSGSRQADLYINN